MKGYGSQVVTNERVIDFQKLALRTDLGEFTANINDTTHQAYALFKSVFTDSSVYPLKRPTLVSQTGFTFNGVDSRVNPFIPGVSDNLVEASQVLNKLADYAGAIWGIQDDDVFLRYPSNKHSGITIKDFVEDIDLANRTSYQRGPVNYVDTMDIQNGFANVLFIKGGVMQNDAQSTGQQGFTVLHNKDIAQQVTPLAARVKNLCVVLSRVGNGGQFLKPFIEGAIVADLNGKPAGLKLIDLRIPILQISDQPTAIFSFNSKFSTHDLQVNEPYWLVFYAHGTDESNTIAWWHDDDFFSIDRPPSAFRTVILDPKTEDRKPENPSGILISRYVLLLVCQQSKLHQLILAFVAFA